MFVTVKNICKNNGVMNETIVSVHEIEDVFVKLRSLGRRITLYSAVLISMSLPYMAGAAESDTNDGERKAGEFFKFKDPDSIYLIDINLASWELDDFKRDYLSAELNIPVLEVSNLWEQGLLEDRIKTENELRSEEKEAGQFIRQQELARESILQQQFLMQERMRILAEELERAKKDSVAEAEARASQVAKESAEKIKARQDFISRVESADTSELIGILKELSSKSDSLDTKIEPGSSVVEGNKKTSATLEIFEMQSIVLRKLLKKG